MLAEVDGTGTLRTHDVLGVRDTSRPRRGAMTATLELSPQIENLREAELHRAARGLGLKRSPHYVRALNFRKAGGFEGPGVISVVAAPDYSAILHLVDKPLVEFDRGANRFPDCGVMEQPHDLIITGVDKPFKPKLELVEVLGPEAHEPGKPLLAQVRPRPRKLRWRQPLAIGGEGSGLIGAPEGSPRAKPAVNPSQPRRTTSTFSSDIAHPVSRRKGAAAAAPPRVFLTSYEPWFYLQPGSSTVCPGGWHFAPASFGPLLLLPGPKSGSAAAAAGIESAKAPASSTAAIFLRIFRLLFPLFAEMHIPPYAGLPRHEAGDLSPGEGRDASCESNRADRRVAPWGKNRGFYWAEANT